MPCFHSARGVDAGKSVVPSWVGWTIRAASSFFCASFCSWAATSAAWRCVAEIMPKAPKPITRIAMRQVTMRGLRRKSAGRLRVKIRFDVAYVCPVRRDDLLKERGGRAREPVRNWGVLGLPPIRGLPLVRGPPPVRGLPLARGLPDTLSVGRERSEALWEGYRSREGISAECRSGEGPSERRWLRVDLSSRGLRASCARGGNAWLPL